MCTAPTITRRSGGFHGEEEHWRPPPRRGRRRRGAARRAPPRQRIGLEDALLAAREVGRQHHGALRAPGVEQAVERRALHSTRSTNTRTRPPQASPTSQASSLVTPNSSRRGRRPRWRASASSPPPPRCSRPRPSRRSRSARSPRAGCRPDAATSPTSPPPWRAPRRGPARASGAPARERRSHPCAWTGR